MPYPHEERYVVSEFELICCLHSHIFTRTRFDASQNFQVDIIGIKEQKDWRYQRISDAHHKDVIDQTTDLIDVLDDVVG